MVAVRQVVLYQHSESDENEIHYIHMNAPRIAALVICFLAVYMVFESNGLSVGFISAVLTAICVAPLFISSAEGVGQGLQEVSLEENESSQIFAEVSPHELDMMREEEHTVFGRILHQAIEMWSEDVRELRYVVQILRESNGLLILLAGGVSTMMLAIVAGLDDVNVLKALFLSVTCYGVTTLLVARSARRVVHQRISQNGEHTLSSADVIKIVEAVPEENFVSNDDLESCDLLCIENMLHCRKITTSPKASKCDQCEVSLLQDLGAKKRTLINELRQRRNYNESCCICLSSFQCGEKIRVLPGCHHEFHRSCIHKWAQTFAAKNQQSNCSIKRGRPTCPLCNACFGEAQMCPSSGSSHS